MMDIQNITFWQEILTSDNYYYNTEHTEFICSSNLGDCFSTQDNVPP